MNLVDSCGWLEFFAGSDRAEFFVPALTDTTRLVVPTICVLEVAKVLYRSRNRAAVAEAITAMRQGTVVDLDDGLAVAAASLAVEFRLPTADAVVLATARSCDATVWTQDGDYAELDGVRFFPK